MRRILPRIATVKRFVFGAALALLIEVPVAYGFEKVVELLRPEAIERWSDFQDAVQAKARSFTPWRLISDFATEYGKVKDAQENVVLAPGIVGTRSPLNPFRDIGYVITAMLATTLDVLREDDSGGRWFKLLAMCLNLFGSLVLVVYLGVKGRVANPMSWLGGFALLTLVGLAVVSLACAVIYLSMLAGTYVLGWLIDSAKFCFASSFVVGAGYCVRTRSEHAMTHWLVDKLRHKMSATKPGLPESLGDPEL